MSTPVYILLRGNPKKPATSEDGEKPCGVVSDQKVAEKFFAGQTSGDPRDWVMFMLDEVPEITGEMTEEPPLPPPPPAAPKAEPAPATLAKPAPSLHDDVAATRKKVEDTTSQMQRLIQELRSKRSSKK